MPQYVMLNYPSLLCDMFSYDDDDGHKIDNESINGNLYWWEQEKQETN